MPKTILIVDNSTTMRKVTSIMLAPFGFQIIQADNGITALQQLENYHVHGIISAINMPLMDGLTAVEKIREDAKHRYLPIIILTTKADKETILRGKEAGVDAWLIKPCPPEKLSEVVQKIFKVAPAMPRAL